MSSKSQGPADRKACTKVACTVDVIGPVPPAGPTSLASLCCPTACARPLGALPEPVAPPTFPACALLCLFKGLEPLLPHGHHGHRGADRGDTGSVGARRLRLRPSLRATCRQNRNIGPARPQQRHQPKNQGNHHQNPTPRRDDKLTNFFTQLGPLADA